MTRCRVCSAETSGRFCSSCGAALNASDATATTSLGATVRMTASSTPEEGRFPPGTLLGQRYRISGRIGQGGMGEVYKATDLLLGQIVALKFLPESVASNEAMLERFRTEVRLARQISHPNVCRVYDLGEVQGQLFLSMEYVDGEDLKSLLGRIGRLPPDKALEIARKLCAGLNAAHEKGVVHRDVKPANIMLDGRGQVRVMDFGLAGLAGTLKDIGSGTPAYMAPEQRSGREVTAQSDIYAVGVVLHELFTGKRPGVGTKTEIDPVVERVIRRCLDEAPQRRPATALAVAAALPGGDPLAAALAAGETPTPEMVANAGAEGGLRVPVAVACLAAVAIGIVGLCFLRDRIDILNLIPHDQPPQALAVKAREIANSLGYTARPVDTASGWDYELDYLRYAQQQPDAASRLSRLPANRPPAVSYWYRENPSYLLAPQFGLAPIPISRSDPPLTEAGAIEMALDTQGRLLEFRARPLAAAGAREPPAAPDWTRLFAAAGLDPKAFTAAEPAWTPETACDAQAAWKGSWPGPPSDELKVEAGAYRGRPVFFRLSGSWSRPAPGAASFSAAFVLLFMVALPMLACLLAWRNARLGRGDRQGAFRLACFTFVCGWSVRTFQINHSLSMTEVTAQFNALEAGLIFAGMYWVIYMALEPYVRRRWPQVLVSWNRLQSGRLRDPLVGGHVLAGAVLGVAFALLWGMGTLVVPTGVLVPVLPLQSGPVPSLSLIGFRAIVALGGGFGYTLLLTLLRFVVRREWLAYPLITGITLLALPPAPGPGFALRAVIMVVMIGIQLWTLLRLGLLPTVVWVFTISLLRTFPLTSDLSAWYAKDALVVMGIALALALYGFRTTLAGRPLWRDELAGG